MQTLVEIRHTINTNDKFYEKENNYFNEVVARFEGLMAQFYETIVRSEFRNNLEKKYGSLLFKLAELTLKTFKKEIIEDLQEENKLGYDNYVELGYAKLNRTDYTSTDVANYRKQVYESLVPVSNALRKRQRERLNYDSLKFYDDSLAFLSGNPTPKGDPDWILDRGTRMYNELSEETAEFFNFMTDNELLDLESKKGKVGGGYCTFISNRKEIPTT